MSVPVWEVGGRTRCEVVPEVQGATARERGRYEQGESRRAARYRVCRERRWEGGREH